MKVSVIIPVYNEEKHIKKCLESLEGQNFKDFEVVVVDDGSTDASLKTIGNYQLLRQKHLGPAAARNLGAKKAKGDILVFVDADMSFSKVFLRKLIAPIVSGITVGTFSKEEYVGNWENVWARCWNYNQNWPDKRRHKANYPDKQKVFRAIKKSAFRKAGGFDRGGYTDDYTLSEKLRTEATAAPGARFFHSNPDNLRKVFIQAKWAAKRKYKFGLLGLALAIIRVSLPVSLVIGFVKSIYKKQPLFLIFKIIYDLGQFIGIIEYNVFGKGTK